MTNSTFQRRGRTRCCALLVMALATQLWSVAGGAAEATAHGQTRTTADSDLQAWDQGSGQWVSPEMFWRSWAGTHGGLTWGSRNSYPPYAQVSERDLLLIELDEGVCLMEFWHGRWRRAQDVRRWSPAFNTHAGCPRVFD